VGPPPPEVIVQLPWIEPPPVYLKTLSVLEVLLTTQMLAPSVTNHGHQRHGSRDDDEQIQGGDRNVFVRFLLHWTTFSS
jgi:hypothetical protein